MFLASCVVASSVFLATSVGIHPRQALISSMLGAASWVLMICWPLDVGSGRSSRSVVLSDILDGFYGESDVKINSSNVSISSDVGCCVLKDSRPLLNSSGIS